MNLSAQNMLLRSSKRSVEHVFPEQTNIALGPTFCRVPPPLPLFQEGGEGCQEPRGGQGAGSVTRADSSSVGRAGSPSPDTGSARVTVTGAARRSASPYSRGSGRGAVTPHNGCSRPPPPPPDDARNVTRPLPAPPPRTATNLSGVRRTRGQSEQGKRRNLER